MPGGSFFSSRCFITLPPPPPRFDDAVATVFANDSNDAARISFDIFSVSGSSTRVGSVGVDDMRSCLNSVDSVLISKSLLESSCFCCSLGSFLIDSFLPT